jgi:hypothetical protein
LFDLLLVPLVQKAIQLFRVLAVFFLSSLLLGQLARLRNTITVPSECAWRVATKARDSVRIQYRCGVASDRPFEQTASDFFHERCSLQHGKPTCMRSNSNTRNKHL